MKLVDKNPKAYKKLVDTVYGLAENPKITVGVHEDKGEEEKKGSKHITLAEVANIHEFGLGNVPERSFIRAWFDENDERARKMVSVMLHAVIKGKYTKEQILEILGNKFVGEIQARISRRIPPPLAEETIRRKGSSVPLIDTGQLRSSISYKVVK